MDSSSEDWEDIQNNSDTSERSEYQVIASTKQDVKTRPTQFQKRRETLIHSSPKFAETTNFARTNVVHMEDGGEYYVKTVRLPTLVHLVYVLSPYWEWLMSVQICLTYGSIMYVLTFAFYIPEIYTTTLILDLLFSLDTLVRLLIEIWRYHSLTPCIVFIVPYTFNQFLLDLVSLIPVERIYLLAGSRNTFATLTYFDYCRLNRFIRFTRVFKFFNVAMNERRISEILMFILKYLTQYLVFLHFVACVFFLILPADPIDFMLHRKTQELAGSWIRTVEREKPSYGSEHFDHFALSISFAACVVTTTGYGDFAGTTSLEMIIMCLTMLIGAIFVSGFFSSGLATFKLEHDGARFDLFFRVGAIINHLTHIKAHEIYVNKVVEYYRLLWNYREGVYDVTFMSELPRSVIEDMFYDICREMFYKTPLFRGLDESFLRAVSGIAHVVIYNPKMILCPAGGYAMNMFYLLQGEVRVKSKLDNRKTGAILRAGCIIGDMNLFFSYPYTTTIETRTCCQLLQIQKFELFEMFQTHTEMLHILRGRVERRLDKLQVDYELVGVEPVCWVESRNKNYRERKDSDFPVVVRSGKGFNKIIDKDVTDDSSDIMIVDMPCLNKAYAKEHTTVFKTCVISPILDSQEAWIKWWNVAMMMFSLYSAIMPPYCLHFTSTNEMMRFLCGIDSVLEVLFSFIYVADIFVEICCSCPVTGIYYKLVDGLKVKLTEITFWIDVASAMPFAISDLFHIEGFAHISAAVRVLRLWRVIRYFEYMDNAHPDSLFSFRLLQALLFVIYLTHLVACYLYSLACTKFHGSTNIFCERATWLRSFTEGKTGIEAEVRHDVLGNVAGYWVSFYFASATVTTTGFGDFNPQTRTEMIFLAVIQLLSFGVTGYYTALLTSALSCAVRPKLLFQQKLIGVLQFLEHKGLAETLQKRIIEHYYLQDQLWNGVSLPENVSHYMYDTPQYLHEDALYLEVELHFDGVPIFTKLDPKILVDITKLMRRYLIPPGAIFVRKGEVRRQMYVIGRGSVGFMSEKGKGIPTKIVDETGHFGLRDLLFGEPAHHDVKTLSYCLLYEVELRDVFQALRSDTDLLAHVEEEKAKLQPGIDAMINEYSLHNTNTLSENAHEIPSFICFPKNKNDIMRHCTFQEYEEVFEAMRRPRIFRWILMHRAIHPAGTFAKFWTSFMSFVTALLIGSMTAETFGGLRGLHVLFFIWDIITWVDVYLKLHWAYYTDTNMLISHPVQTAIRYIFNREFVYDILITTPFEFAIPLLTQSNIFGYSKASNWYCKFRWTRFGQVIRIPAVVKIIHSIFKMRTLLLLTSYVSITLFICTIVANLAEWLACPTGQSIWEEGDEYKLPFCKKDTFIHQKASLGLEDSSHRWVIGFYYICQVMFSVGYGDMTTLNVDEMQLMIFVSLFGFAIVRCILSDITAAEVDIDEVRQQYQESLLCVQLTMNREKVPNKIRKYVLQHLYHTWDMSKGLQPRQLFRDLHPALVADLFRDLVGDDLKRVPIFQGFRENILRTICQYMNTLFFRKGERITRYGNMEREMFIIVKGQVWIADKFLVWTKTLGSGESFGEVSIIHGARRSYSAVAATDVELFVLSFEDFRFVLQRYPAVIDDLKLKLKNEELDIFQTVPTNRHYRTSVELDSLTTQIRNFLEKTSVADPEEGDIFERIREGRFLQAVSRAWGSGNEDENLPFLYFTNSDSRKCQFLIHPNCTFMRCFTTLVIVSCWLTPALALFNFSFSEEIPSRIGRTIQYATWAFEIPMILHIFLAFITPFQFPDRSYCKVFNQIAFNYITTFGRFPIDIISTLPLLPGGTDENDFWRYAQFIRTLRLIHFYRTQLAKVSDLSTSTFKYKITLSMTSFLFMVHFIACFFYYISLCSCSYTVKKTGCVDEDIKDMCKIGTWTYEFIRTNEVTTMRQLQTWQWWVRSVYWVITTVSTTGFGDITPINTRETLLCILTIFGGAFIISIILSHFASGIASLNKSYRAYLYQVNLLLKHMRNIGMSEERRDQVMSYFVMRWEKCRGVNYQQSTAVLPSTMNSSVSYFLYSAVANKNIVFSHGMSNMFLRQLCSMFSHSLYIPGINVINEGYVEMEEKSEGVWTPTGTMFIVYKGQISAYGRDTNGRKILTETYSVGQLFAEYSAIFFDMPYNKTYRAETHAEVLGLTQSQVAELMRQYPQFAENVKHLVREEYSHIHKPTIFDTQENEDNALNSEFHGPSSSHSMNWRTKKSLAPEHISHRNSQI